MRLHRAGTKCKQPSGVTATEVIVVISVIAVLLAIVSPAVLALREVSRKTSCANNLRQLSQGMEQYVATYGQYAMTGRRGLSIAYLFPYVDQTNVYTTYVDSPDPWTPAEADNIPHLPVLVCPSDSNGARKLAISYGENRGYCYGNGERISASQWPKRNGVIQHYRGSFTLRPFAIRDGFSNTAMFAEMRSFPRPDESINFAAPWDYAIRASGSVQLAHCELRANTASGHSRGASWLSRTMVNAGYIHLIPPNGKHCSFQPTAGSDHSSVAGVALCDGSVRWCADQIDQSVWADLGTFDGMRDY